jgi:hypothetical protein
LPYWYVARNLGQTFSGANEILEVSRGHIAALFRFLQHSIVLKA